MENERTISSERTHFNVKQFARSLFSTRRKAIATVVTLVIIAGVVVALAVGAMVVVFKHPGQKIVVFPEICGSSTVEGYNTVVSSIYPDEYEKTVTTLKTFAADIQKKSGYKNDSNCVFISFQVAYLTKDYTTAKDMADRYKELVEKGQPADGRLSGLAGTAEIDDMAEELKPSTSTSKDSNE